MKAMRKIILSGASILLAGGATLAGAGPAHAIGYIDSYYPDEQSCRDAGLDKFGHPDPWWLHMNQWGCSPNLGPDGGWMLWSDDGYGD